MPSGSIGLATLAPVCLNDSRWPDLAPARTGQVTAQATDDVVGEFAREREDLLVVAVRLDRVGHLTALGHDLVVRLLLLGGHGPVLGLGLLGEMAGLGQLWADLRDASRGAMPPRPGCC
jgi:hypothetical protein